jgi:hypothetical protein
MRRHRGGWVGRDKISHYFDGMQDCGWLPVLEFPEEGLRYWLEILPFTDCKLWTKTLHRKGALLCIYIDELARGGVNTGPNWPKTVLARIKNPSKTHLFLACVFGIYNFCKAL